MTLPPPAALEEKRGAGLDCRWPRLLSVPRLQAQLPWGCFLRA